MVRAFDVRLATSHYTDTVSKIHATLVEYTPDPRWDISGDGSVTSLDALMILQAAAGDIIL